MAALPDHIERARLSRLKKQESEQLYQANFRRRSRWVFAFVGLLLLASSVDVYFLRSTTEEPVESIEEKGSGNEVYYKVTAGGMHLYATEDPAGITHLRVRHSMFLRAVSSAWISSSDKPLPLLRNFYEYAIFLPLSAFLSFATAFFSFMPDKYWNICWFLSIVSVFISTIAYLATL
jgi:hypothetical protein